MSIFLSYVFLGLSLAAPIGPINAAQLDKGIKMGFPCLAGGAGSYDSRCHIYGGCLFGGCTLS